MTVPETAPRLIDVADRAGVSMATASRALSGSSGVSRSAAEHVRDVAAQMGYVANLHARSLAGGATTVVGLVVHEIGDPYFSEIASGVLSVAAAEGLTVQICHSGRDPASELTQIRTLIANRVGAIIVAGSGFLDPTAQAEVTGALQAYRSRGGRVAVIGRHHINADAVLPDNRSGGRRVAEHLIGLGHELIGLASGSTALTTVHDRLQGISDALEAQRRSLDDVPIVEAEFTREGGKAAAETLLEKHPGLSAVVALNDDMAIGVLSVLRASGVSVPGRVSVTGFDDVAVAGDLSPSLTTIRLPMAEMGRQALRMALAPVTVRPRRRSTGQQLIVRDSSGPAPTAPE